MSSTTQAENPAQSATPTPEPPKVEPKDNIVESEHVVTINGQTIRYKALTGTLVMKNEEGKAKASIFFVAYFKEGLDDPSRRPLTISFNGGPGSSSVWLHLGLLGPRRVLSGDVNSPQTPPYRLIDNNYSLLDTTDLLFIDPVSTGYSRPAQGEDAKQFHSVESDIESVGDFIRLFVTRYQRWGSPKFLIGESYGTTRAAGLSGYLQERYGMYLNGLMLVSVILNFQTGIFAVGNDLAYALYLPTYTATAWYHRRLDADLQSDLTKALAEAEQFAANEYTLALMKGDKLQGEARTKIAAQLARYTGLSQEFVERANLRIEHVRFCKELLRNRRRTVGRIDSRFTGIDRDAAGEYFEHDPSISFILGSYSTALNDYLARELKFNSDLPYAILASLHEKWDYSKYQNRFVNMAETLRSAMSQNPHLKVFVASGFYDLATPYFATDYTLNHLDLDASLRDNISYAYYPAGHMMYVHEPSLVQLKVDLVDFVLSAMEHG